MITRSQKLAVGIFVVATVSILVGFLGILWGVRASRPMKRYLVVTDSSVSGLSPSSAVKYLGVDAGKVDKMEYDNSIPPKVRLTLALFDNTPVKKDTKAQLTPQGITGIQFIELIRGESKEDLAEGAEIAFQQSKLTDIVTKIDNISAQVDTFFGQNKDKVSKAIDNANDLLVTSTGAITSTQAALDRFLDKLGKVLDENREGIKDAIAKLDKTLEDVQSVTATLKEKKAGDEVLATVAEARDAIKDLRATIQELKQQVGPTTVSDAVADVRSTAQAATAVANETKALVQKLGGRAEDDLEATGRAIDQLTRTVRSLQELTREVKERPAILIRDLERQRREVRDR